ncbi:MAG: disulfide bond formation protein DsbA [Rhodobacterales bacterium]|nr:MAG: disulfide bond formation protein DsbA [Rhodobacterales bacterium]
MKRPLFALALAGLAAAPAQAFDLTSMTSQEQAAFRAEVRAFLLENPEVIMEAIHVLENREAAQQAEMDKAMVTTNFEAIFNNSNSYVGGNPDGDITLVEFVDYRCGYCRKAHDEVAKLLELDGNIRLIVKEFPILGEASVTSSRFAIAVKQVAGDAAYKAAANALIKLKSNPNEPVLRRLAGTLGVDADAVMARMDSDEVTEVIRESRILGQRLSINGTPTFILQDQMLRGYLPLTNMLELVERTREQG